MTIHRWPAKPTGRSTKSIREQILDPLPVAVLHSLVAGLPGPKDETAAERAVRFDAQLAEVLSHNPRDSVEAMIATQTVVLRLLSASARDRLAGDPARVKQMERMFTGLMRAMRQRQSRPLGAIDPTVAASLGLGEFLISDPHDPNQIEEAASARILALHPAPKMLQ